MWFLNEIVSYLDSATGWFYDAYLEVNGWISPFDLLATPLYWVYSAFYYLTFYFGQFNDWLAWAADRIAAILGFSDIWSYFLDWFTMARDAWDWVFNALYNVWNICNEWWDAAQHIVIGWVQAAQDYAYELFNTAAGWWATAQEWINVFISWLPSLEAIDAWWSNWTGNVLQSITDWWNGAISDVMALIDSSFLERENFWAGWQDWRGQVTEFFTSPLDWVAGHLETWFWGDEA